MKMDGRTRLASGLVIVALLGGAGEAVALPKAISLVVMRGTRETRLHSFVQEQSKYVTPEWGSDLHRYVGPLPQHFHGYVSGRLGF